MHANSVAEALMRALLRALLRPVPHRVTVTNHGHVEPVLISRGEVRVLTGPPALPLGLGGLAETGPPVEWHHRFTRGDVLLLVTDGLVEARSPDGAFHPLVSRLRHHFADHPAPGPGPRGDVGACR
ncbi:SpoIIE family protein phosphatase [Streptomyces sp. NPDC059385]|uniref:SpoIIE family protein phosphatase n=1 Tax=Streptomyces sp. NPDC059385 TaxID=3346817 RepID=UPI00368964D6